jgi:hypothetical protein
VGLRKGESAWLEKYISQEYTSEELTSDGLA